MASLITEPLPRAPSRTGALRWAGAWLRRLGLDTLYLLLGLPMGVLTFSVAFVGWATSLCLAITLLGLPLAIATIAADRGLAWVERRRAALVLGEPIAGRYLPVSGGRILDRLRALVSDRQNWHDLGWHLLLLPIGTLGFGVAVCAWTFTLWGLTFPLWWQLAPQAADFGSFEMDSWGWAALAFGAGLLSLPLTAALVRGSAAGTAAIARAMLGRGALQQRVERLTETRAGAVDAAAAELQRIERDLHDGAQARLVALAMDLGMAQDRFDRDPQGARELVDKAQAEAKQALVELRELARGMRPGLLAERGLDEAVRALAARTPLATAVHGEAGDRCPPAAESAAYFVVAEALTNAVKHAHARHATVRLAREDDRLVAEVSDDGRGGADPAGSGLAGLRKRVEALDGTLRVASPPGGPTLVRAEVPCAS